MAERVVACEHEEPYGASVCAHLLPPYDERHWFVRWYGGEGMDADFLCQPCLALREQGESVDLLGVCWPCRKALSGWSAGRPDIGAPGIVERPHPIDLALRETDLPDTMLDVLDFAAVDERPGDWIVLGHDGTVGRLGAETGEWNTLGAIALPVEPLSKHAPSERVKSHLHVSAGGGFAAVVNDYGSRGAVYDLRTLRRTLECIGGDYHADTVPFAFAFAQYSGRTLALHRTDWNRLDASDAATGQLLTARSPTDFKKGEQRPPHYLDYFHGALHVSPDNRFVLDDGWEWAPIGVPAVWDLDAWLTTNAWESEDGSTLTYVPEREDCGWNSPICWLDATRFAIGGLGEGGNWFDGVRVFDTNKRDTAPIPFAGPGGAFFSDGVRLFSSAEDGLSIWDVEHGTRSARIAGFRPTRQHRGSRELAEIAGRTLRRWRY